MRKIFILLLLIILCTGCMRIDKEDNKDLIIEEVLNSEAKPNTMARGYKYYLPLGVSKVYDKDYNQKFKFDDNYIYLYVDVVSYFYNNSLNFSNENNNNNFYYKEIKNGNKNGYIKITEEENELYLIKIVYNYAKIETYIRKKEIRRRKRKN